MTFMIEQVDGRLTAWVKSVLTDVNVYLAPPEVTHKGRSVAIYLLEIVHAPIPRTSRRPPLQFTLRYLVTTDDNDAAVAHQLLGELILAAIDSTEFEVEPEPVPIVVWTALGVPPRPSLVLRVPVRIERPQPVAKRVRMPLTVNNASMLPLSGLVLGPDDFPLAGAEIELPALQLFTHTDFRGRFRFAAVPVGPPDMLVRVRAKGREVAVSTAEHPRHNGEPLVIRIAGMED